ncbi:MAG TPA: chemotaxis protein CheW [Gemmatimonadaceae bacterium]
MTTRGAAPARPAGAAEAGDARRALLLVRVGPELFAFDLVAAEEAVEWPALERLPQSPRDMLGVFAFRGRLVPVYTPESALAVARTGVPGVVVVTRSGERRVGLAVDDVEDVIMMDRSKVLPPPVPGTARGVVLGVARHGEELVSIVDLGALVRAIAATDIAAEEGA